eukprot:scaffold70042_cov15-Prasinocladus_malaysianus.AAC.1
MCFFTTHATNLLSHISGREKRQYALQHFCASFKGFDQAHPHIHRASEQSGAKVILKLYAASPIIIVYQRIVESTKWKKPLDHKRCLLEVCDSAKTRCRRISAYGQAYGQILAVLSQTIESASKYG